MNVCELSAITMPSESMMTMDKINKVMISAIPRCATRFRPHRIERDFMYSGMILFMDVSSIPVHAQIARIDDDRGAQDLIRTPVEGIAKRVLGVRIRRGSANQRDADGTNQGIVVAIIRRVEMVLQDVVCRRISHVSDQDLESDHFVGNRIGDAATSPDELGVRRIRSVHMIRSR